MYQLSSTSVLQLIGRIRQRIGLTQGNLRTILRTQHDFDHQETQSESLVFQLLRAASHEGLQGAADV